MWKTESLFDKYHLYVKYAVASSKLNPYTDRSIRMIAILSTSEIKSNEKKKKLSIEYTNIFVENTMSSKMILVFCYDCLILTQITLIKSLNLIQYLKRSELSRKSNVTYCVIPLLQGTTNL